MKHIFFGAWLCLATSVAICYATMGGQYSVNIHFVPPLVTGTCTLGQLWNPPNVTCALCFCMTGTLSRCVPQPGCIPNNSTTTTTENPATNPSTASPAQGTQSGANVPAGTDTQQVTRK